MRTPFLTFAGLLLVFLYIFASVGMELLGGKWYRGAECLASSDYATEDWGSPSKDDDSGYYLTHFNDFPSAMVTVWALLMVNNFGIYVQARPATAPHAAAISLSDAEFCAADFHFFALFMIVNVFVIFLTAV